MEHALPFLLFSLRVPVLYVRPSNDILTIRLIFMELLTNVMQVRDHPASASLIFVSVVVFVGNSEFKGHRYTQSQNLVPWFDPRAIRMLTKPLNINLLVS